ncbi:hypothetical protein E2F50_00485 [Rhizobium deserti]|uniref:Uncharacterized protein n=1 Tax=Rhizobium deserti TaxID=2547961 RepID=A0A4V3APP7_9HYPH|nr:hypothetical protein [Rhizobium deserti]TDK38670.1 hypothetical protein E2F50_00485 [Rhizobium deserti]
MTQMGTLSVSANVAALNMEVLKVPRQLSVKDRVADVKSDADRNAQRAENAGETEAVEIMIPAANVSLDLLTTGQQPHQQATIREAQAAYQELDDCPP